MNLLWLFILIIPVSSSERNTYRDEYGYCNVTNIKVELQEDSFTVRYKMEVVNHSKCSDSHPEPRPICNIVNNGDHGYLASSHVGVYNRTSNTLIHNIGNGIQFEGSACNPKFNGPIFVKCGALESNTVDLPKLDMEPFANVFDDSRLELKVRTNFQPKSIRMKLCDATCCESQHPCTNCLSDLSCTETKDDKTCDFEFGNGKNVVTMAFNGNFSGYNGFCAEVWPTDDCLRSFVKKWSVSRVVRSPAPPENPQSFPIEATFASATVALVAVIFILLTVKHYKRLVPVKSKEDSPMKSIRVPESILIVHTSESQSLIKNVQELLKIIQDTGIKKVYDISFITEQDVVSNHTPWLMEHFHDCPETLRLLVLVCSPGLAKLIQALKEGIADTEAIQRLDRGYRSTDCMLVAFIRKLYDSTIAQDCRRFFTVWFENNEGKFEECKAMMSQAGLCNIGDSVLYRIPAHNQELKREIKNLLSFNNNPVV